MGVAFSQLVALTGAPAPGDEIAIVDISDLTQSSNGSTKRTTITYLFTTPAISSPTITGTLSCGAIAATGLATITNASVGAALLTLNNSSSIGAGNGLIEFWRGGSVKAYLNFDGSDQIRLVPGSGSGGLTVVAVTGQIAMAAGLAVTGTTSTTALTATAGITSTGPTGAGIGYATGAGLAITQITSASTAVTINALSGEITTVAQSLGIGVFVSFTVNNSTVAANDVPSVVLLSGNSVNSTIVRARGVASGSFVIDIISAANTETGTIKIQFVIQKGVKA